MALLSGVLWGLLPLRGIMAFFLFLSMVMLLTVVFVNKQECVPRNARAKAPAHVLSCPAQHTCPARMDAAEEQQCLQCLTYMVKWLCLPTTMASHQRHSIREHCLNPNPAGASQRSFCCKNMLLLLRCWEPSRPAYTPLLRKLAICTNLQQTTCAACVLVEYDESSVSKRC